MPPEMTAEHQLPESAYEELAMVDAAIAGENRAYLDAEAEASRMAPVRTRMAEGERDPADPFDLGQGQAQRSVPVRFGQEIQALPRRQLRRGGSAPLFDQPPPVAYLMAMSSSLPILYSFRRCPYAMRARLALLASGQRCQLREIVLRDKAAAFLAASPKGNGAGPAPGWRNGYRGEPRHHAVGAQGP